MTKVEFSEIAFIDFLHFLLSEDKAKESFKTMSGFDLKTLGSRSPLDKMIDDATGYEQDIMSNFVVWAAESFWDEPEELEQIEVYKKAKKHINKKVSCDK